MKTKKTENVFNIKYGSENSEVDVETFIESLESINSLVFETTQELGVDSSRLKIKAIKPGSVDVFIELVRNTQQALAPEVVSYAANLLTVVASLIVLKQAVGNKQPEVVSKDSQKVVVKNSHGGQLQVAPQIFNIFISNPVVDSELSNNFKALTADSEVSSFEIRHNDKSLVNIPKADFAGMSASRDNSATEKIDTLSNVKLSIIKVAFTKDYKWAFNYNGRKIHAIVVDDNFHKSVDEGKKFSKGDVLEVELEIKKQLDLAVRAYFDTEYVVKKVLKHIPRQTQDNLPFM